MGGAASSRSDRNEPLTLIGAYLHTGRALRSEPGGIVAFQNGITVLVAAAVWWHTVAGCCAHHAHTEPDVASPRAGEAVCSHAEHDGTRGVALNCLAERCSDTAAADHDAAESYSPQRCERLETRGMHRCPASHRSDCSESRCAFVASNSWSAPPLDESLEDAVSPARIAGAAVTSALMTQVRRAQRPGEISGAFLGNASRRHLALGVFLL